MRKSIFSFSLLASISAAILAQSANAQVASINMGEAAPYGTGAVELIKSTNQALNVNIAGGGSSSSLTITDRSTTITAGGTAQTLMAANTSRKDCLIQNPTSESELLYVNVGATAATTGNSVELLPGMSFNCAGNGGVPTALISVVAATTSHKIIAKEGQ